MKKLIKYIIIDILRNKVVIGYSLFLLAISLGVFNLEDNAAKGLVSLLNIVLIVIPLLSIIFSTIYFYNSAEFIELLLSQPVRRFSLIMSMYFGLTCSLMLAVLIGIGLPILLFDGSEVGLILLLASLLLTIIFVALAMLASILSRDKAKGIGISILIWFYFAIIYDALILFILFQFQDYPIEKASIALTALNPIDISRILVLLKMDISAMMGYTGAVFKTFFEGVYGYLFVLVTSALWALLPAWLAVRRFNKKDF